MNDIEQKLMKKAYTLLDLRDAKAMEAGEPSMYFQPYTHRAGCYVSILWKYHYRHFCVYVHEHYYSSFQSDEYEWWGMQPEDINKHLHWLLEAGK